MKQIDQSKRQFNNTLDKLNIALSSIHESIILTDTKGTIQWCNYSFLNLCNQKFASILGMQILDILQLYYENSNFLVAESDSLLSKVSVNNNYLSGIYTCRCQQHDLIIEKSVYFIESMPTDFLVIIIQDITAQRELIHQINNLNAQLENAQHVAHLGSWRLDWERKKLELSKELRLLMGFKKTDKIIDYAIFLDMVHPNDRTIVENIFQQSLLTGEKFSLEIRVKAIGGQYRWGYVVSSPEYGTSFPSRYLSGIAMDITKKKHNEQKIDELNRKILQYARKSGRADVATSMLHNVGNILNTINVSSNILKEIISSQNFVDFFNVCSMLSDNIENIEKFLLLDDKGKLIPNYLAVLSAALVKSYNIACSEIENINIGVEHVRDILTTQHAFSKVTNVNEPVQLKYVIEQILKIFSEQLSSHAINVVEKYEDVPMVSLDRIKLEQILANLIKNAEESIVSNTNPSGAREITVTLKKSTSSKNMLSIEIKDNGGGISNENLTNIFAYGYTTKNSGQGIGLHNSALAASEMGGALSVSSDGAGCGALFILELPIR